MAAIPDLGPQAAEDAINAGALLLDVRETVEWQQTRVPGATLVPMTELRARIDELPADRQVVVMCAHGNRSQHACHFLAGLGLDVANLAGGIEAWWSEGKPVETGRP